MDAILDMRDAFKVNSFAAERFYKSGDYPFLCVCRILYNLFSNDFLQFNVILIHKCFQVKEANLMYFLHLLTN